jgi:predicted Rossmann fold nucleotide-binding protein DprA/Smf involved in DNA uptake
MSTGFTIPLIVTGGAELTRVAGEIVKLGQEVNKVIDSQVAGAGKVAKSTGETTKAIREEAKAIADRNKEAKEYNEWLKKTGKHGINYAYQHWLERLKVYKEQKFPNKIYKLSLKKCD